MHVEWLYLLLSANKEFFLDKSNTRTKKTNKQKDDKLGKPIRLWTSRGTHQMSTKNIIASMSFSVSRA